MSFFASFVNGVMRGADWREGRDDRRTQRERAETRWAWDLEDREHTLSERARVDQEREQSRARGEAARAERETRRQADLAAWDATGDWLTGEGGQAGTLQPEEAQPAATIWYDPPVENAPARAASNAVSVAAAAPASPSPQRPPEVRGRMNRQDQKLGDAPASGTPPAWQRPGVSVNDVAPIPSAASSRRDEERRMSELEAQLEERQPQRRSQSDEMSAAVLISTQK